MFKNSVKAGRLLPYLQYQLYAKQKGPLFPGMALQQTSEIAGPSHGLLQPSLHHRLHLPQRSIQHSLLNHEQSSSSCQNNSVPHSSHSRLHQGNIQPQPIPQSSAGHFIDTQPSRLASGHLNTDPRHGSPLHTYAMSNPKTPKPPHKPPQSTLQTPHANLQHQRAGQPQPQISSTCSSAQSGCKEEELKMWVCNPPPLCFFHTQREYPVPLLLVK